MTFWQRLYKWLLELCRIVTREECTRQKAQAAEAIKWVDESNARVRRKSADVHAALSRLNTSL